MPRKQLDNEKGCGSISMQRQPGTGSFYTASGHSPRGSLSSWPWNKSQPHVVCNWHYLQYHRRPICFLQYLFTQSCRVIWRILHRQKGDFCSTSKLPIANEFFRRHSFFCFFACSLSLQLRIIPSELQYIKAAANRRSGKSLTYWSPEDALWWSQT